MPESKRVVESMWGEFWAAVQPEGAPEIQRVECRRAFFAGALMLFSRINAGLSPGKEPTSEDVALLEALLDAVFEEFEDYRRDLRKSRA